MLQSIEPFFKRYAKAYSDYVLDDVLELVSLPCLLLTDDSKTLIPDVDSLKQYVLTQFAQYKSADIASVNYRLQSQVRLSDNLRFASLYWMFLDNAGNELFSCHSSYTLQSKDDVWQVVAFVTDNEQKEFNRYMAKKST